MLYTYQLRKYFQINIESIFRAAHPDNIISMFCKLIQKNAVRSYFKDNFRY